MKGVNSSCKRSLSFTTYAYLRRQSTLQAPGAIPRAPFKRGPQGLTRLPVVNPCHPYPLLSHHLRSVLRILSPRWKSTEYPTIFLNGLVDTRDLERLAAKAEALLRIGHVWQA